MMLAFSFAMRTDMNMNDVTEWPTRSTDTVTEHAETMPAV